MPSNGAENWTWTSIWSLPHITSNEFIVGIPSGRSSGHISLPANTKLIYKHKSAERRTKSNENISWIADNNILTFNVRCFLFIYLLLENCARRTWPHPIWFRVTDNFTYIVIYLMRTPCNKFLVMVAHLIDSDLTWTSTDINTLYIL